MAHDVFISYAVEDGEIAGKVCGALEAQSIKCWMAPRDIPFGADYEEAIVDAISTSSLLVLILSSHSNGSPHVKREIQNACAEGSLTQILPFRIDAVAYSKALRYYLGSAQWLDASTPPLESHLDRLVRHVRAHLRQTDELPDKPSPPPGANVGAPPPAEPTLPVFTPVIKEADDRPKPLPLMWIAVGAGLLLTVIAVSAYLLSGGIENTNGNTVNSNLTSLADEGPPPTPSRTPSFLTPTPSAVTPTPQPRTPTPTPAPTKPTPTPTPSPAPTPSMREVDTKIGSTIRKALGRYSGLSNVIVSVRARQVTLEGSVYVWSCRDIAEKLSYVEGVVDVINNIKAEPRLEGKEAPAYPECATPDK